MKRKVVHIQKLATELYDAKPELVSLVKHGANQTPFKVLKAEQAAICGHIEGEDEMNKAEIAKAQFAAANFKDEEAVKTFMEAQGFTDCAVIKTDAGFEVIGAPAEAFDGTEFKSIEIAAGAVFQVGKLKQAGAGLEAAATVAKSAFEFHGLDTAGIVKKYDYYLSSLSNGTSIEQVMADARDGYFPGLFELNDAFYTALRNLVIAGEVSKISGLCAEFGAMITELATLMKASPQDVAQKMLKAPEAPAAEVKETKAADAATEVKDEGKTQKAEGDAGAGGEPAAEAAAPAAGEAKAEGAEQAAEGQAEAAADNAAGDAAQEQKAEAGKEPTAAEVIAAAIAAAMSPVTEALKNLGEQVLTVQKSQTETAERVEGLEKARQTRKSADADGVSPPAAGKSAADKKAAEQDERQRKSALGFLNPGA